MRTKWLVLLIASLTALTLWGCGSNGGSGGDSTSGDPGYGEDAQGNDYVGAGECIDCHQGFSWSAENVEKYLAGKHVINRANAGFSSSCLECHDPIGDSATVEPFIDPEDIPDDGLAAVGCENCHGGGGNHFGVGPMPVPNPTYEACGDCHNNPDGHPGDLYDKVISSQHNNEHGSSAKCQRCHTTEGSIAFSAYTGDKTVMDSMDEAPIPAPLDSITPPLCMTCHDPHDLLLLEIARWDPNDNGEADEFDLCTSCHTYYNQDDVLTGSGSVASETAPFYHNTRWNRIITTTHYDNPDTGYGQDESIIEGYNVRKTGENPCFDCHGHELLTDTDPSGEPTIHTQWASSRHGGELLEAKYDAVTGGRDEAEVDAVMMAGREDEVGHGWSWTHYNWDDTDGITGRGRGSCQRCHTATGTANYMDDPENYDPENNDFSHLEGWSSDHRESGQNEMLYCWGCHSNAGEGKLRNPGAILEDYGNCAIVQYGDIDKSNSCMSCHIGREIGKVVQNDGGDFNNRSFINSHYLAAGASVFSVSGFEYEGLNYAPVSFYKHDSIGTPYINDDNVDDSMGPCAGCHLTSEGGHLFLPFEINEAGNDFEYITEVCADCHGDSITVDLIEEQELGYAASLEALNVALGKIDIFYASSYPYFFNDLDDTSSGNAVKDWIKEDVYPGGLDLQQAGKNTMGAAFNFNLGAHEPAGYAHNRYYYKRLFWDSIDWADDYTMNGSVADTIAEYKDDNDMSDAAADAALEYLGDERPDRTPRAPIPGLDPTFPPCDD